MSVFAIQLFHSCGQMVTYLLKLILGQILVNPRKSGAALAVTKLYVMTYYRSIQQTIGHFCSSDYRNSCSETTHIHILILTFIRGGNHVGNAHEKVARKV